MKRILLGAAVAALAAATPAAAYAPPNAVNADPLFVITKSATAGATHLSATCAIYADRLTADYGPTTIRGIATSTAAGPSTHLTCSIYYADRAGGVSASAHGTNVVRLEKGAGTIGVWGLEICVDAVTYYGFDQSLRASDCARI